jgi:hypothetical protein
MGPLWTAVVKLGLAVAAILLADREARRLDGTYRPASRRRRIVVWTIVVGMIAALVWCAIDTGFRVR